VREPGVVTDQEPADSGSGNVLVGYGTTTAPRRRRRGRPNGHETTSPPAADDTEPSTSPGVISPLVRKLARDSGVDLRQVAGSGPYGSVRRADVDAARAAQQPAVAAHPA